MMQGPKVKLKAFDWWKRNSNDVMTGTCRCDEKLEFKTDLTENVILQ